MLNLHLCLGLERLPEIRQTGLSQHGFRKRQSFTLKGLYALHLYHYAGSLKFRGEEIDFEPGDLSLIPPDTEAQWTFPNQAAHHYLHFRLDSNPTHTCPVHHRLGRRSAEVLKDLETMGGLWRERPLPAAVRLWDLLFRLTLQPIPSAVKAREKSACQIAISEIENRLHERLRIADLAQSAGVSTNYLIRLFRQQSGCTPLEYLNGLRATRAEFLLRESSLPIKSIAASVGFPDLQQFNKFIRKRFGQSPRRLRMSPKTG